MYWKKIDDLIEGVGCPQKQDELKSYWTWLTWKYDPSHIYKILQEDIKVWKNIKH